MVQVSVVSLFERRWPRDAARSRSNAKEAWAMNEAEYLRERAKECYRQARSLKLRAVVTRLEAQAAEFERRAAEFEARLAARK